MSFKPTKIIIHHSAGQDTDEANWKNIKRYHVEDRGWNDIGYHALVEKIGDEYMNIDGRPDDEIGAHAKGSNSTSLGICFVGDYTKKKPTNEHLDLGALKIAEWMQKHNINGLDDVIPHRDVGKTTCPGKSFPVTLLKDYIGKHLYLKLEGKRENWETKHWQRALNLAGFAAGPVDNIIGPKTKGAKADAKSFFDENYDDEQLKDQLLKKIREKYNDVLKRKSRDTLNDAISKCEDILEFLENKRD